MGDAYLHGGSGTDGSADRLPADILLHLEILKISAFLAMFRKIIVLIPLIYIMPHMISDSTTGVYMAEPIADIYCCDFYLCFIYIFSFKKRHWQKIQN